MNQDNLENLLREKIATEKPRPGFETRVQALAREPQKKHGFNFAWLALPGLVGLAAIVIGLMTSKTAPIKQRTLVSVPTVGPSQVTRAVGKSPMHQEVDGLRNDTRRALSLFQRQVPSLVRK